MPETLTTLIDEIEQTTEGSRGLDIRIVLALTPGAKRRHASIYLDGIRVEVPDYTTSLDAALSLVPKGWWVDPLYEIPGCGWRCDLRATNPARVVFAAWDLDGHKLEEYPPTPALALTIAALRAIEAERGGE